MNRRKFFKWLGVGVATAAVAPYADTVMGPACVKELACPAYPVFRELLKPELAPELLQYVDYTNFSDFAISAAIDDSVANTARELSYAAAKNISQLYELTV